MQTVRKGTFETNSSSTHAIGISKSENYNIVPKLSFKFGEFGWEYEVYFDTSSKASYLYTIMQYFDGEYSPEKNKYEEYIQTLKMLLKEANIRAEFEEPENDDWDSKGYIDHGADGDAQKFIEFVLESKENLFRYLFNENSFISTGNDNEQGYYIPTIGYYEDYYDNNDWDSKKWKEKIEELSETTDLFLKGN